EQTTQLLQQYVQSVIESGVACCHHTCGNPAFDRFVQGQMAVLGLTPEQEEQYWEAVEKATEREKPTDTITSGTGSSSGGFGLAAIGGNNRGDDSGSDSNNDDSRENSEDGEQGGGYGLNGSEPGTPVTGYEMIPTRLSSSLQSFMSNPTFSAASIIAILIVVFVVGAVFYGSRRKGL
ncbi:MAG: hypothetical protein FWH46_02680, partial [Methanimicrococcus sp.]|nr:hypothetical protein [Methanimicrococcus sp.]